MVRFINLEFNYRDALGVNTSEYILLQVIYFRQNAPNNDGWCSDKKSVLGKYVDVSERWIKKMISNLEDLGLVEVSKNRMKMRTTTAFYDIVFNYDLGGNKVPTQENEVDTKFPPKEEQSSHLEGSSLYNELNKKKSSRADALAGLVFPFDGEEFKKAWDHWLKDRSDRKKKNTLRSAQAQLKKLANLTQSESDAILIIFQSIEEGWQTFYPLRESKNGQQTKKTPGAQADNMASRHESYAKRFGD